ncbi:hypothetical protein Thiowin_01194 [Thiorhodovibrio winogradskyi]|uniref:Uncharacterized protein n=1 Tax=Thiorhodovibrio winogradskyi TaxID=77007 RepID=A0ABZ0S7X3_9GAMM|nr:hypothetical protein [Thiorhodovibrio winogradskyi]
MSKTAPDDAPEKATKSPRVWPKLLLWSLVLAFGFLYLRSLDYPAKDSISEGQQQVQAPKPAAPPQQAQSPSAAVPPRAAASPAPVMPRSEHVQTASPPRQVPPAKPSPEPSKPSSTVSSEPADASQGKIKATESEAFAQRVMRESSQPQAQTQEAQGSQAAASAEIPNQAQPGGAPSQAMPPRAGYPQPPAQGYGQPVAPVQSGAAYQNQYADYMRQQREAYEAARKRWEEAYRQYPQGQSPQVPAYGGYPGYYPPGYYR